MNDFTELSQLNEVDRDREQLDFGSLLKRKAVKIVKDHKELCSQKMLFQDLKSEMDRLFKEDE